MAPLGEEQVVAGQAHDPVEEVPVGGDEAVAAQVEAEPVALDRAAQPPGVAVALDDERARAAARRLPGGAEPRGASAEDHDVEGAQVTHERDPNGS